MRYGALQVRGSLDASGGGSESRSKSPRRTSCFLEVPTDPMFRSRSRSLDDGTRVRVPPSDCEATYRIYDEIVKEGKSVCFLSTATLEDTSPYFGVIHMSYPQECREGTAVSLILKSVTRHSLHFTVLLLTYLLLFLHCQVNTTPATETWFRLYSVCCYGYSRSILRSIFRIP